VSFDTIRTDLADGVLTITLHRPDRLNAFTHRMRDELIAAFDAADSDDDVRAVIVTGAGRAFCAGADLEAGGSTFDVATRDVHTFADGSPRDGGGEVSLRIYESTKPVIAAINGPAVGVGITMTLPMDVRLAVEGAKIGFVFTRRGSCPRRPRAISCHASSASRVRWSGCRPDAFSQRRRRWQAASSGASTHPAS
jgi:enoyl-CoA hydratase/carnithine racemase